MAKMHGRSWQRLRRGVDVILLEGRRVAWSLTRGPISGCNGDRRSREDQTSLPEQGCRDLNAAALDAHAAPPSDRVAALTGGGEGDLPSQEIVWTS